MLKLSYFIVILSFITGCTQGKNPEIPAGDMNNIPTQEIEISKLISLDNGDLDLKEGSPSQVTEVSLGLTAAENKLAKKIILTNNSSETKFLDIKVLNNSKIIIHSNQCDEQLPAGKSCFFIIRHLLNTKFANGVYTGILNVSQDGQAQAAIASEVDHPDMAQPTTGDAADLQISFKNNQNFDNFQAGDLGHRLIQIKNSSSNKNVENISFTLSDTSFKILYSNCPSNLPPGQICLARIYFMDKNQEQPPAELNLAVNSGNQSSSVNLVSPPIMSGINLLADKKGFSVTGNNFQFVKSVKIIKDNIEIDNLVIENKTSSSMNLKFSKNIILNSNVDYIFRFE